MLFIDIQSLDTKGPKVDSKTMKWEEEPREETVEGQAAPSGIKQKTV